MTLANYYTEDLIGMVGHGKTVEDLMGSLGGGEYVGGGNGLGPSWSLYVYNK